MTDNDNRRASDILLDLESKIITLISAVASLNTAVNTLSNRINKNSNIKNDLEEPKEQQKFSVEAADVIPKLIKAEAALPVTSNPLGIRRGARAENYAGEKQFETEQKEVSNFRPALPKPEVVENQQPIQQDKGTITVTQRVVNGEGKSLFLADVAIVDNITGKQMRKLKTNASGSWTTTLNPSSYLIKIKKIDPALNKVFESSQIVEVHGTSNPLNLSPHILR